MTLKENIMNIIESELPLVDVNYDNGEVRYRVARPEIAEELKKAECRVDSNNVPQYLINMIVSDGWKLVYELDDIVTLISITSCDNGFDLYITSSRQITVTSLGISLGDNDDSYLIKFRKDNVSIVNYQNERNCRTYNATIKELSNILPVRIFEAVLKYYAGDYPFCDDMIKTGFYPPVKLCNLSKFAELCS